MTISRGRPAVLSRVFPSLQGYQRSWAGADAVAAVTLLVIAVPEQLATSRLAGMPPITGFYAFIAGTVAFALLGTNPRMSVGADSTIAPLIAVGVAHFAPSGSAEYVNLVGILAVMVGVLVALVGLLRLGWIAEFLSAPIITGFLAGVAAVIVIHQLPDLLGIPSPGGSNLHRLTTTLSHLGKANGWAVGMGLAVLALIVGAERINRRIPGALFGLLGSTALVASAGLRRHGVPVLGAVAHGEPRVGLVGLSWHALGDVAPVAAVVALVVVSQTAATTRAFPGQSEFQEDANQDFVAVGVGSVVAGLVGSFPVDASPPRTAAVESAGGRTQAACLAAAAVMAMLVPAAGLLRDVPLATLAGVLLFVAARIFHVRELMAVARFDLFELGLALVTLLTVALIGVEQGIAVAVGLAILDRTRLSARPQLHVLGRIPGTTSWAPLSGVKAATQVPGVLVVLFATPLWYANAVHFRAELERSESRAVGDLRLIVLDALGMSDIDFTGARELTAVVKELEQRGIEFAVARAGEHVRQSFARSGLEARIGEQRFFPAVDEAVTAMT